MEEWVKHKDYQNFWVIQKVFNGCNYVVGITVDATYKSVKFYISLSSGKKRKELSIFEDKENKSLGGISALLWCRDMFFQFPNYYNKRYSWDRAKRQYLCIHWSDNRRRNIYERLSKEGFIFMKDTYGKCLMKKL